MLQTDSLNLILLVLQAIAVSLLCYWLWTRRNWYLFCLRTPGYWGLPVLGQFYKIQSANNILPSIRRVFEDLRQDTVCVWMGLRPVLLTKDPVFIDKLLTSHDIRDGMEEWHKAGQKMVGESIVNTNGPKWQRKRKLIAPFFQKQNILQFFPIFNDMTNTLIEKFATMDEETEHEVSDVVKETFFGSSLATILNQHPKNHTLELRNYLNNGGRCLKDSTWNTVLNYLKVSALSLYDRKAFHFVKRFVYKRVTAVLDPKLSDEKRNEAQSIPGNFLDFAKKLYQSQKMSKKELIAETHALFEVSAHSTQVSIYSTLVLLAMHPNIQKRLFTELKNAFVEKSNEINVEQLKELPYLDMVINETLRLIPPLALLPRSINKDTKLLDNWNLPKGLQIMVSLFDLHQRTDVWGPDANEFNPDHFLPENFSKIPPGAYLPFSKGPRNCIGSQYGLYIVKIAVAALIRNFEFRTTSKYRNLRFTLSIATEYLEKPKLQILKRYD